MCAGGVLVPFVELVVYADGTALVGAPDQLSWAMTQATLGTADLASARSLASTALRSPTPLRLNPGVAVADAGIETLTGWSATSRVQVTISARTSPGGLYQHSPDANRVDALTRLIALVSGAVIASGGAYAPSQVALFVEPASSSPLVQARRWPGPELTTFGSPLSTRTPSISADVRCGIADGNAIDLLVQSGGDRETLRVSAGRVFDVLIRPLLPGETTCDQATLP